MVPSSPRARTFHRSTRRRLSIFSEDPIVRFGLLGIRCGERNHLPVRCFAMESTQNICNYLPHNLGLYRDICPPEALYQFDAVYNLELTQFDPARQHRREQAVWVTLSSEHGGMVRHGVP